MTGGIDGGEAEEELSVLLVCTDGEAAETAGTALERHGLAVTVERKPDRTFGRLERLGVDCFVVPGDLPGTSGLDLIDAVRDRGIGVPAVVLLGEADAATVAGVESVDDAAYVEGDLGSVSYGRLAERIRVVVADHRASKARESERDVVERLERRIKRTERQITALHGVAMRLGSLGSVDAVYEETVAAAERILDLDICFAFAADEDRFVPKARSSTPTERELESLPLDAGAMGETYRTGESIRAVDMDFHSVAEPAFGDYRSGISVPIGDTGVFQAVAGEPGAFDEVDLEMAELLTAHAGSALQRLEVERQLRVERDRFAALFENSDDCIVEAEFVDGDSIIRRVNPSFEEMFGHTQAEAAGESVDDLIVPEDRRAEGEALTREVREGNFIRETVRRLTADGERDFLLRSVPVAEDTLYAVYTDITDRKEAERELEERNERLDEFSRVVSHDLRNPLSIALGRLQQARDEFDSEDLDAVGRALVRMDTLTEELLTLARQGTTALDTESVSLADAAEEAWESVETGDTTLVVTAERAVVADPGRLQQLLENLFRNAVEHGFTGPASQARQNAVEHGSKSPEPAGRDAAEHAPDADHASRIRVGDLADGGFYVADDGQGIPPDERERVFDSGYSTSRTGTGFGLVIVKRVAESHGWTVSAAESEWDGARFEFRPSESGTG